MGPMGRVITNVVPIEKCIIIAGDHVSRVTRSSMPTELLSEHLQYFSTCHSTWHTGHIVASTKLNRLGLRVLGLRTLRVQANCRHTAQHLFHNKVN